MKSPTAVEANLGETPAEADSPGQYRTGRKVGNFKVDDVAPSEEYMRVNDRAEKGTRPLRDFDFRILDGHRYFITAEKGGVARAKTTGVGEKENLWRWKW